MSMTDAIDEFRDDFDILGSSQAFFEDYSWYKDISYDYISEFKRQYEQKKHIFLVYEPDERGSVHSIEENKKLSNAVKNANQLVRGMEVNNKWDIDLIFEAIDQVEETADKAAIHIFHSELKEMLETAKKYAGEGGANLKMFPTFNKIFGRSSQYISFVRK